MQPIFRIFYRRYIQYILYIVYRTWKADKSPFIAKVSWMTYLRIFPSAIWFAFSKVDQICDVFCTPSFSVVLGLCSTYMQQILCCIQYFECSIFSTLDLYEYSNPRSQSFWYYLEVHLEKRHLSYFPFISINNTFQHAKLFILVIWPIYGSNETTSMSYQALIIMKLRQIDIWYWPKPHIIRSILMAAEIPVATPFNPRRFELWDFWFDWQLSENVERSHFRTWIVIFNLNMRRFWQPHLHRGRLHPNWQFLLTLSWCLLRTVKVELLI